MNETETFEKGDRKVEEDWLTRGERSLVRWSPSASSTAGAPALSVIRATFQLNPIDKYKRSDRRNYQR